MAVSNALELTAPEARELEMAADRSKTFVDVESLPGNQRELVAAFARKLDDFPADFLEQIKKRVFKSVAGDLPFKRQRRGLLVAPASTKGLWELAEQVRSLFMAEEDVCFPIMDVLEFRLGGFIDGYYLDVCSHKEMGQDEGRVFPGSKCIKLREDVYQGAWSDVGRHRFTACHEFGHFLIHRQVAMARVREDDHPVYRDAEWQADTFAGGLLMSSRHLSRFGNHQAAAAQCGMTPMAASVMWSKYKKEGLF